MSKTTATFTKAEESIKKKITNDVRQKIDKLRKEIPIDRHLKWYADTYSKQMPSLDVPCDYVRGMMKRVSHISSMKYGILPNMLYGNTVVFKLHDINQRKEVNYATLFCEDISDISEFRKKALSSSRVVGNIVLEYYSISSSFISCDGEYRSRFNQYKIFLQAKLEHPELWNEIDQHVSYIIKRRQWSIYASYFHGRESENNTELEQAVKSDLIAQSLIALCWFHTIYTEYIGLSETHMNESFKDILLSDVKNDLAFMKDLIKKHGAESVENFKVLTSHVVFAAIGSKIKRYIPLGYKMIPLNLREVQDPLRLKYKPWREFLVANKCNDLIINQISPSFSVVLDWFLIKKSNKGLFDNKSQYERLKHSELAKGILTLLHEAQRSTYFATSDLGKNQKTSEQIKQWISTKFRRLSDKINEPINYSIEEIIMSDITLAYPSEYVGRTFADTINLISNKQFDEKIGRPFSRDGYDTFAKYMFEVCYGLLAINKKLGVIHGDFHLNNATIGQLYLSEEKDNRVVYQLDSENKYMFKNNGYFACIIDFSRALLNPEMYEQLIDLGLPENIRPVKEYDSFESNETNNLLNWYLMLYPNKSKHKEELLAAFKTRLPAIFKLMTCMDLYMFTIRLLALLRQQTYSVGKKCLDLVEKINRLSETYVATEMNTLIKDASYADTVLASEYPIAVIIKKCFSEYIDGKIFGPAGVVSDYYNMDNELKQSLGRYDMFPDALKYSKYYDLKGKIVDVPDIDVVRKEVRVGYEQRKLYNLEHLKFLAHKYM